ncbi:hypothetical protein GCM10009869_31410 [Amnibacterium kyonggiense]
MLTGFYDLPMHEEPRTRPCPHGGCSGTATVAAAEDYDRGAPIWTCDRGHLVPRLINTLVEPEVTN